MADFKAPGRRQGESRIGAAANAAPGPEALEKGRLLFARPCLFMRGVAALDGLPPPGPPEVAFAGRSNVGKSTLVNALTGRRTLARTSGVPGHTRQLNFFDLGDGLLTLVDMPGHGYARAPKTEVRAWTALVRDYLRGRAVLRRLFLLIDSRHGLKPPDLALMDMLDTAGVSYQLVLTKTDKAGGAGAAAIAATTARMLKARAAALPEIIQTAALKGTGVPLLRARIAALLPGETAGEGK